MRERRIPLLEQQLRHRVKELRKKNGWSIAQLALAVDVTEQYLSSLLAGRSAGSVYTWDRLLDEARHKAPPRPGHGWRRGVYGPHPTQRTDTIT